MVGNNFHLLYLYHKISTLRDCKRNFKWPSRLQWYPENPCFEGAPRPLFLLWTFSLCIRWKTKTKQKVCGFYQKNFVDFVNLMKIEFRWSFENLIIYKPSLVSCDVRSHTKFGPDLVQMFWRLLDTIEQTKNKQTRKVVCIQ